MTNEEIIAECKQRLGFETGYEMYSLCQHEKDFYNAIIKALEQQSSDDCVSRQEVTDELNRLGRNAFKDDTDYDNFFTFVDSLPPVTPTHGTCKDCKYNVKNTRATTMPVIYLLHFVLF